MTGIELKTKLEELGIKQSVLAEALHVSKQNLHAALLVKDVRTGFLEQIAEAMNISPCDFYKPSGASVTILAPHIKGNSGPVQSGNGNQLQQSDPATNDVVKALIAQNTKLIEMLEKKQ